MQREPVKFLTTFCNDVDHPNEPAKCKENGQVSDNFFVNDLDHPDEPAKCKEDGQVSDNFFVNDLDHPLSRPNAKRTIKFLTTFL